MEKIALNQKYFNSTEFIKDSLDLVLKHLTDEGKKYEQRVASNKVLQRFLIDFTIIIEQTINIYVEYQEHSGKVVELQKNLEDISKRLTALEEPPVSSDDPMIH